MAKKKLPLNAGHIVPKKAAMVSTPMVAHRAMGRNKDVAIQDQTTPAIILPFHRVTNSTTLSVDMVADSYTCTVTDPTGIATGSYLIIYSTEYPAFSKYYVVSVLGSVVTLDSLIDIAFSSGATVDVATDNMGVNGALTPITFGLRGSGSSEPVQASMDLTRIIIVAKTDGAVDLAKFGDITALTRGLLFRHRNGFTYNVFNIKSNGDLASLCYDWTPYSSINPAQGQNGFVARLTFAGQSKIGVAIRINPDEDAEVIIQDDLSDILTLKIIAEGHVVD